jgi:LPXTG-site transpeptidase (sortase) family protein
VSTEKRLPQPWWRTAALVVGVLAVVAGGVDLASRAAGAAVLSNIAFTTFAPAALLLEPELVPALEPASTEPLVPVRLVVPAIGVDAEVEQVGKTLQGAMATPEALANVGWYRLGAQPGAAGNAVFAGHVNNALGLAGVFKELSKLKKGDEVRVQGQDGTELVYVVERIDSYKEAEAPVEEIFATSGPTQLVLITCEGEWDEVTRTFDKRLVVVARR